MVPAARPTTDGQGVSVGDPPEADIVPDEQPNEVPDQQPNEPPDARPDEPPTFQEMSTDQWEQLRCQYRRVLEARFPRLSSKYFRIVIWVCVVIDILTHRRRVAEFFRLV